MTEEQREPFGGLNEAEIEQLVERVTERVVENFYAEVGRNVVKKFLWLVGMIAVGVAAWLGRRAGADTVDGELGREQRRGRRAVRGCRRQ